MAILDNNSSSELTLVSLTNALICFFVFQNVSSCCYVTSFLSGKRFARCLLLRYIYRDRISERATGSENLPPLIRCLRGFALQKVRRVKNILRTFFHTRHSIVYTPKPSEHSMIEGKGSKNQQFDERRPWQKVHSL